MQIKKSWYYDISTLWWEILIASGLEVIVFDAWEKDISIKIGEKSKLQFFWYYEKGEIRKTIINTWENSEAQIKICNFSLQSSLHLKTSFETQADYTKNHTQILSFAWVGGHISLEAKSCVEKNIKKAGVSLLEKNIFLDENAFIRSVPWLFVASDDVEAHHACQIEKIDKEHLFYLQSRGINHRRSLCLLLEASFKNVFSSLKDFDEAKYQEVFKKVMKHIQ